MPEDTQAALRVASAGSGTISHTLLAKVTGRTEDELTAAIRPAVTGNVLVTTADGYAFRHALIREAVHEDLLPGEHSGVHTRFARAIETDPALVCDGRADIEKAHHWYSAHNTTGALTSAWQASAQASRAVAHAERLMLLERVLELWDQVPDAAERIGADHVRVLEEAADVARDAGEHQRGLAFTELALTELEEAADPVRVALLLSQRHTFRRDLGQLGRGENLDLDRALSLVPESASRDARTKLLLAAVHYGCHEGGPAYKAWAQEALGHARESGDRDAEAQALAALGVIEAGPLGLAAPGSEPLRLIAEARQIAEGVGAYQPFIKLVIYESHLLCGAGEYERAAVVAHEGIADAERHGLARTRGAFLAINVAEPLLYLGRWDEAMDVTERALDLAPPSLTRVGLWTMSGWIALARGDLATAARRAASSRAVLSGVAYDDQEHLPQAILDTELALASGGPAAAVAVAAETIERYDLSVSSPRYVWPLLVAAAAVAAAAIAAGQAAGDAAALLCRVATLAEKLEVSGPVQRAWQLSYAAADPQADAVDRLAAADQAAAAWEAIKQPYPAAIALARGAAIALSGAGGREAAAARLRRAAPIAERLGARPLAEQIADLSRRAGDIPAGDAANGDRLGLTGREFEVLRLVAAGQSNRDIAGALFISPKTASVHVSNILGKLGASTRTEAAAKAHALRLFDDAPAATLASRGGAR